MAWVVAAIIFLAALFPVVSWLTGWQSLPEAIRKYRKPTKKGVPHGEPVLCSTVARALPGAPPDGDYRAHKESGAGTVANELLEIAIDGDSMTVASPEWTSSGKLRAGVYVGRFKYHRGETPKDTGTHELTWNGREFRGSVRFDHAAWGSNDLVWRPTLPPSFQTSTDAVEASATMGQVPATSTLLSETSRHEYPAISDRPDGVPTRCFRCGRIAQYGSKCAHCGAMSDDL